MNITYTMDIHAPIDKVFECIDNDELLKKWMHGLVEVVYVLEPDNNHPVGTKFTHKIKEGGKVREYDGEVIAYEKPSLLGVRLSPPMFTVDVYYRLSTIENGTRLHYECMLTYHNWFAKLIGSVFSWFSKKILHKQMNSLKELAESL
jgi:uncharacterized protein YndB with AHSA1/START domain